jgi:hypothetical protein
MSNLKSKLYNPGTARSYCITFLLAVNMIFSARSQSITGAEITIEGEVAKTLKLDLEVVFSLAEIDPAFTAQTILLACEADGYPLEKRGWAFQNDSAE